MKDRETEELVVRWTDGETLTEVEKTHLEYLQHEDPSMVLDPPFLAEVRRELRTHFHSSLCEVPHGSALNASVLSAIREEIQEQIGQDQNEGEPASKVVAFPGWLRRAAVMAACFLVGLFISQRSFTSLPAPSAQATVVSQLSPVVYSPYKTLSTNIVSSESGYANLIVIEGLSAIPDDVELFTLPAQPIKLKPLSRPDFQ